MSILTNLSGTATAPPGAVNLARYPGLCHAPGQWGDGIRFAQNGKPVESVASDPAARAAAEAVTAVACAAGVTFADALDAIKYLRDAGAI